MNLTTSSIIIIYYFISVLYMIHLFREYSLCPELLWCASQFLMFFGITYFIDDNFKSDGLLLVLYLVALICFILSSEFSQRIVLPKKTIIVKSRYDFFLARKIYIWIMMLVCIVLCSFFFARAGGNVFFNGLRALLSGTDYSTKYARMSFLSISGVGYIYQLRVTVFPLLVFYYATMEKRTPVTMLLVILMLVFLVGTGQRGGLFSFIAIFVIGIYYIFGNKNDIGIQKKHNRLLLYGGTIGVSGIIFVLSTILNGRVVEGSSVFSAILKRFIRDNQACAVYGFRYISTLPIQHGRDWLFQFLDVLPGKNSYMSLDTRIFAYMHGGSTAGTSPPCIWGSAYYNFGILGVVFLSTFLGLIITNIHARYSRRVNDECNVIIYSAEQFLLAYWVAAGPIFLFNSGFISVILLGIIMKIALRYPLVIRIRH